MGPTKYLRRMKISASELSRRCEVPRSTLQDVMQGGGVSAATALKLIEGSGGLITLNGLVEEQSVAHRRAEKGRNR